MDTAPFIILYFFAITWQKINLNLHRAAVLASATGKLPETWHNAVILLIRNNIVMSLLMLRHLASSLFARHCQEEIIFCLYNKHLLDSFFLHLQSCFFLAFVCHQNRAESLTVTSSCSL